MAFGSAQIGSAWWVVGGLGYRQCDWAGMGEPRLFSRVHLQSTSTHPRRRRVRQTPQTQLGSLARRPSQRQRSRRPLDRAPGPAPALDHARAPPSPRTECTFMSTHPPSANNTTPALLPVVPSAQLNATRLHHRARLVFGVKLARY